MSIQRRRLIGATLILGAAIAAAHAPALAQGNWPSKPITLVVSYPAGGDTDAMARLFADTPGGAGQSLLGLSLGLLDAVTPARRLFAEQMMFGRRAS